MRSAYAAPTTFGVISEKIRIASAMATPPTISDASLCPNRRVVITAVSVVAMALTSVLPRRMTPSSLSVRARSPSATLAPRSPCFAFRRSRCRLTAIIAVSAIEKKPETASSATSEMTSVDSGMSSKQRAP